ncbi:MAG: hypothetical protein NTNFB02_35120 [Nitrospira sp.]
MPLLRPDFSGNFTRGSDTAATHMRLLIKGALYCFLVFAATAMTTTLWLVHETVERTEWDWFVRVVFAKQACSFDKDPACQVVLTIPTDQRAVDMTAANLAIFAETPEVQAYLAGVRSKFTQATVLGVMTGCLTAAASFFYFLLRGWRLKKAIQISGLCLAPAFVLYWKLTMLQHVSPHVLGGRWHGALWFSGMPMIRGTETLHSVYIGATGVGKTQLMHQRIDTARHWGEHGVVYDDGGILLSQHFRLGDIILNPFDARSAFWTPFAEITCEADCRAVMESLFPISERTSDPIWINSARVWGTDILWKLYSEGRHSNKAIYDTMKAKLDELIVRFENTVAGSQMAVDRTGESIRAELLSRAEIFRFLPDAPHGIRPFSIRRWALNPQGWLFFPVQERWHALLKPLLSLWIDQFCLSLFDRLPDQPGPCTWLILDEVGSLQRLPSLERLLMKGRKFNCAVLLGIQTFAAIRGVYGPEAATNLLGNCHTRVVFLLTDPETAEQASRLFGDVTTMEPDESLSMGPHPMRDGMTLSRREVRRRLIPPEQFLSMRRLTAYVRLPEDVPATFIRCRYRHWPTIVPPFIPFSLSPDVSEVADTDEALLQQESLAALARELTEPAAQAKGPRGLEALS